VPASHILKSNLYREFYIVDVREFETMDAASVLALVEEIHAGCCRIMGGGGCACRPRPRRYACMSMRASRAAPLVLFLLCCPAMSYTALHHPHLHFPPGAKLLPAGLESSCPPLWIAALMDAGI
jgi:hypothetical protein